MKENLELGFGDLFQSNEKSYIVLKTYFYDDRILALSNECFKSVLIKNDKLKILRRKNNEKK